MNLSIKSGKASAAISTLVLSSALLVGCGKKEEEKQSETTAAPAAQAAPPAPAAAAPITITGNDQMQFSTKAFEVTAGSQVTLIMQNAGTMPKEAMGHNLTILKPGTQPAEVGNRAMNAKATDYIPAGDTAILFHTRLLGPGESDTLTFTAPPAGEYPYMCTFPGHFAVMNGVMTSK